MVLKILRKAPNKSYCENVFSDVRTTSQNSWACPAIDKFRPLSNVSKAEVIAFFVNALYKDKLDEYKAKNPNLSWEEQVKGFAKEYNFFRSDL